MDVKLQLATSDPQVENNKYSLSVFIVAGSLTAHSPNQIQQPLYNTPPLFYHIHKNHRLLYQVFFLKWVTY